MKNLLLCLLVLFISSSSHAQNIVSILIKDNDTKEALANVSVITQNKTGRISDKRGMVSFANSDDSLQIITYSLSGYLTKTDTLTFSFTTSDTVFIYLEKEREELEEIVVQSTRTSRSIQNIPTRVEVIDAEEVEEKNNMKPANVSMILHESTGIQVQQTSATSANASIRIQGLDGRYTQLLKDGYPNFGNFSSGLSLLEIPPLDLKQVEIIKGPSTLFGGGAIAGVVNFISKTPKQNGEYNFIFNQSNVGQTNVGAFAAKRNKRIGYSILGAYNLQKLYDVDHDDFTELPQSEDVTINPKVFFYPTDRTTLTVGNSFTTGKRKGGDVHVLQNQADSFHTYFEENNTIRNITTAELNLKLKNNNSLVIKQSFSYYNRVIKIPAYTFIGRNYNAYTDISYLHNFKKHLLVTGGNFIYDQFNEQKDSSIINRNNKNITGGIYAQDTWELSNKIKVETGLRVDNVKYSNNIYSNTEWFALPRISILFRITEKISSRIGSGLGYKVPTIFTEQTETIQYQNVTPLHNVIAERSIGSTADINYKTSIGNTFSFSVNQLFFYTQINKPLVLQRDIANNYFFSNATKPVNSMGFETNAKLIFKEDLKLFAGYTYTEAKATYLTSDQFLQLLPRHKLNLALIYEKEKNFKLGLEAYYTDKQYLSNYTKSSSYWELGFMAEKTFNKISLFINFENFTDTRQSKYKRVVNEPHNNPTFDQVWTHTEGFTLNGGVKIKW